MKKILAAACGAIFALGFAASVFAADNTAVVANGATQITLGGELRTRGWYKDNISSSKPLDSSAASTYDQRVRLTVDAAVASNLKGFVMLESGNTGASTTDVYAWGNWEQKASNATIQQAWMLYTGSGLLGFNAGLKVGHMPLALGEQQFFRNMKYGDDAIVFFMDPNKQTHIGLLTVKFQENTSTVNSDDLDGYVGLVTYKWDDKNTVGLNYTYLNMSNADFAQQNLGLHANGNVSGLAYKAEVDMQFGHVGEDAAEVKYRGYALMLGLGYKVDPVNLRAAFAMGSGDNDATDDKDKSFSAYQDKDQHYTFVYEYLVKTAAGSTNSGISNTTYYNLGVDYSPAKDWNTALDLYLLRATKTADDISKSVGWEIDAKVKYDIMKNLAYQIDAGYLKAGSYYEDVNGDKKSATVLRHMLTLSF